METTYFSIRNTWKSEFYYKIMSLWFPRDVFYDSPSELKRKCLEIMKKSKDFFSENKEKFGKSFNNVYPKTWSN